jgi:hypothetical protein
MTAFCVSSTSRSRPLTFMIMTAGGAEHIPEPIPPNQSVETSEEDAPAKNRSPRTNTGLADRYAALYVSASERSKRAISAE